MTIPPTLLRDRPPDDDRELESRVHPALYPYNTAFAFTKFQHISTRHVGLKGG